MQKSVRYCDGSLTKFELHVGGIHPCGADAREGVAIAVRPHHLHLEWRLWQLPHGGKVHAPPCRGELQGLERGAAAGGKELDPGEVGYIDLLVNLDSQDECFTYREGVPLWCYMYSHTDWKLYATTIILYGTIR